jgi:hypothetical protein
MYESPEEAARAYDTAAWRVGRSRREMNFSETESLAEAEFLARARSRAACFARAFAASGKGCGKIACANHPTRVVSHFCSALKYRIY